MEKIAIGKSTKYRKVKMDVARIVALYKSGKPVSQIALAIGFPKNCGQNRCRRVLEKAGICKPSGKKAAKKSKAAP